MYNGSEAPFLFYSLWFNSASLPNQLIHLNKAMKYAFTNVTIRL